MPKLPADLRPGDRVALGYDGPDPWTVPGERPPRELTVASVVIGFAVTSVAGVALGSTPAAHIVFTDGTDVYADPTVPVLMAGGSR